MAQVTKWKFAVDRGGTFTDVVGLSPEGDYRTLKLLSSSPEYENASIEGIKRLLNSKTAGQLPESQIESIRFGTTVATNALLEQKGGNVCLITNTGFRDLLAIGHQARPEIFNLKIDKPELLYDNVIEIDCRTNPAGNTIKPVTEDSLKTCLNLQALALYDAVAVVLIHSWKNPEQELQIEKHLKAIGIKNIFLSHKTVNLIKMVSRGQSTLIDAYLSPAIAIYLNGIKKHTGSIPVEFIQSSGNLSAPEEFKGKDAILSGPAGGVIAIGNVSNELNLKGAIGFDMGGTSTDVSRFDGQYEKIYEQDIAGVEIQKESLNINTIAAGGGSVLWFDGQKMKVGPHSAGAEPGPSCYGFGGPLTITDANLFTGRLAPEFFPKAFGKNRKSSLDVAIIKDKFEQLTAEINEKNNQTLTPIQVAQGFIRIASEKMALAIKEISVSRGYDIRNYALICFGGAGGQHACQIADYLGIKKVIFHPLGGVMSAYGIGLAQPAKKEARSILKPFTSENFNLLEKAYECLLKKLAPSCTIENSQYSLLKEIDIRPQGTDSFLSLNYTNFQEVHEQFKNKYKCIYGFDINNKPLEIVNIRLTVYENDSYFPAFSEDINFENGGLGPISFKDIYFKDEAIQTNIYLRKSIPANTEFSGPAFIVDNYSTLIIDPRFNAKVMKSGIIEITKEQTQEIQTKPLDDKADPILLEVFNNLFMGIASEMGYTLRNTSHSVNIKERLDFSCAIFDAQGELIANAPHIPVHLGSMTETVKAILQDNREGLNKGDLYVTNNPYRGGSHLPDITVVCPVFDDNNELRLFTASRGHHADIGGTTPGSLPAEADHINEEGVLIDSFLLVRNGIFREQELRKLLSEHEYPVRNIDERIYDLQAQVAACYKGMNELNSLILKHSWELVAQYMGFIQDNAEFAVKQALMKFLDGKDTYESSFIDYMDDDTPIKLNLTISAGQHPPETVTAKLDFTGTGDQHYDDNLNTPISVTRSAILYVLRTITNVDIPLNSGCIKPIEIIVPEKSLLNPEYPVPVASGNVETSQRIVDVVLGALDFISASQGTMNNFLFQVDGDTPYYETIAGGSGAMEGYHGTSAVQVHMTNTRITDPEVLEHRHPGIQLEHFTIRKNSGGSGKFNGGNGILRVFKFLKPASISIISERRNHQPYGIKGGQPGKAGKNIIKKQNGKTILLPNRINLRASKNELIIIETPGAGGYGTPDPE